MASQVYTSSKADISLKGKTALITGAGRGIGAATASLLASRGARVVLMSRTQVEIDQVAEKIVSMFGSGSAVALTGDVSDETSVRGVFEQIRKTVGPIEILVNNAGVIANCPLVEMKLEDWRKVIDVNLTGVFLCSKHAFVQMRDSGKGGSIVNISSLGGIRSTLKFEGYGAYVASKHGVSGLTEALSVEGKAFGVRVNAVAPGAVDTAMLRKAAPGLKTRTKPEAIAQVIAYLCDEKLSGALTGAVIEANTND
jgi:NAD(P)-dependent dehydrogenase (short-subunit alcohol dehydrogenase family)